jgi:heme exporter protein A
VPVDQLTTGPPRSPRRVRRGDPEPVVLEGLAVDVRRTPVLRDVALTVGRGEVVALTGPNGAGKSTLLRVLATLLPPSGGRGRVLGADLTSRRRRDVRRRIALIGHEAGLHPALTLGENLDLVATLVGVEAGATAAVLEIVGLDAARDRRAAHCSHGMVRRAELARALLTRPELLLVDEAHAGLDPAAAELVRLVLADVRRRGGASVVVSHDLDRVASLADRVVELDGGGAREVRR